MYDRLRDLLIGEATKEALKNDNTARSSVVRSQPGSKISPSWVTRMSGTVKKAVSAKNRIKGKATAQPRATTQTADNTRGKATTVTVSPSTQRSA
jgi:hypothetical protein